MTPANEELLKALKEITYVVPFGAPIDGDGEPLISTSNTITFAQGATAPVLNDFQIQLIAPSLAAFVEERALLARLDESKKWRDAIQTKTSIQLCAWILERWQELENEASVTLAKQSGRGTT